MTRKLSDSHYVHSQERKSLLPLERLKITFLLFWWIFGVNGCCVNWLTHKHELLVDIVRTAWFFLILTRGINRGYYLAAQRHEISLRVLENISRVSPPFELFYDEFKVTKCCTKTFCLCWVLRSKIAFMRCVTFSNVLYVFGLFMNN